MEQKKEKGLRKIELELMDWKAVERGAEQAIRMALMSLMMAENERKFAKQKIIQMGGKTSEQELKDSKDSIAG